MSKIKSASKETFVYGIGASIPKLATLLLLPFYTRVLSPAEYGVLSTISILVYFITAILSFGLDSATPRFFFRVKQIEEKQKLLSTSFYLRLLFQVPFTVIACIFSTSISIFLFQTEKYSTAILITFLLIPIQSINNLQTSLYRLYHKPWAFTGMTLVRSISLPLLGILFVVHLQMNIFGAQFAKLITAFVIMVLCYFTISKNLIRYKFIRKRYAKQLLVFGAPFIFAEITAWVNNMSDRFFLLHYTNLTEVGLYSIANSFAQPLQLLNMALGMGIGIFVMSSFENEKDPEKPETKRFQTQIWHIYLYISIILASSISLFSVELTTIVTTTKYIPAMIALPWLLLSQILLYSYQITGNGMSLMMNSKPYPIILTTAALINILLNFIFIPRWGFLGAAITTVISNFVYFVFAYFWSQKVYAIKRSLFLPLFVLVVAIGGLICESYLKLNHIYSLSISSRIFIIVILITIPLLFKQNRKRLIKEYLTIKIKYENNIYKSRR